MPNLKKKKRKILPQISEKGAEILNNLQKKEHPTKEEKINKDKEIETELKSIYRDNKGAMPNLTKLDFIPKNRIRNLIILIISFLLIVFIFSVLGFFVFQPKPKFTSNKVALEIKAPFTANSGENINYQIKLTNNEDVSLTNIQLDVFFPSGFIFSDSSKEPLALEEEKKSNIRTWKINDLFTGKSEMLNINGYIIGPLASKQVISATINYIPANFSSEFQKNSAMTTEISGGLLDLTSAHAAQIANAEIIEIKAMAKNTSTDTELNNIQIDFNFPAEFALIDSQVLISDQDTVSLPKIDKNFKYKTAPDTINFDLLLPQEEKNILYRGKFEVGESKSLELNLQVKLKGPAEEYYVQKEDKFNLEIIKGDLLTNLIVQGSNQNKAVNFGDALSYLLTLENKSKKTLGDIKVRAVIDSPVVAWAALDDKNNGIYEEGQILWTKDQIPALALLLPEDEINIDFTIDLKSLANLKKYKAEDLLVKSFFETQINTINNTDTELISQSNTIINELNSDLKLQVDGRYFGANSETLGSGPLPPIVGQKTTYKIFWALTNSLHEITDIEVKARLPDYINYEGRENYSTGNIFKNQNNEIVWQIARIPNTVNEATAQFDISLTPRSEDVLKILTLIQGINLIATDNQTKGQITLSSPGLTTNLDTDPLGKGKGLIQAE